MERLRKHAGRTGQFHVGPITVVFTVQTTGAAPAAVPGASRDLEVPHLALPAAAPGGPRGGGRSAEIEMQGDM